MDIPPDLFSDPDTRGDSSSDESSFQTKPPFRDPTAMSNFNLNSAKPVLDAANGSTSNFLPPTNIHSEFDLLGSIEGMFRILDLISEQGSGGLVDKVIIDQESFRELINTMCPGAYVSPTKVNFKALDKFMIKPIGVYGNKTQIASLLLSLAIIDESTVKLLCSTNNNSFGPRLGSGLYFIQTTKSMSPEVLVVYWPEDTTWEDDAVASVRRNRVTFMRYLTKLVDQLVCLLSSEQSQSISWKDDMEDSIMDFENDETDRLFTFEVAKTKEQEENVSVRQGFKVSSREITTGSSTISTPEITQRQLLTRLVPGETCQVFLNTVYIPSSFQSRHITNQKYNLVQLRSLLTQGHIILSPDLGEEAIRALVDNGLKERYAKACADWEKRRVDFKTEMEKSNREQLEKTRLQSIIDAPKLESTLLEVLVTQLLQVYPFLDRTQLIPEGHHGVPEEELLELHPDIGIEVSKVALADKFSVVHLRKFQEIKDQLIFINVCSEKQALEQFDRENLIQSIISQGHIPRKDLSTKKGFVSRLLSGILSISTGENSMGQEMEQELLRSVQKISEQTGDMDFLSHICGINDPLLQPQIFLALDLAHQHFRDSIQKQLKQLVHKSRNIQEQDLKLQLRNIENRRQAEHHKTSSLLLIGDMAAPDHPQTRVLEIEKVGIEKGFGYASPIVSISGSDTSKVEPVLEYKIHILALSADHRHNLQLNNSFIPSPHIEPRFSFSFSLPLDYQILCSQVLENDMILLVIDDRRENISIYLETLSTIGGAIRIGRPKRKLRQDKIGKDVLIAFDETKRMLSFCAPTKLQLHIYVFDEGFSSLQAWGNVVNLVPWYSAETQIFQSCFVIGGEEVLLIDTGGRARIFSLVTQQFRPASLSLQQLPTAVFASPDGACLILSFQEEPESRHTFRAYHWSTFGSTNGIELDISPLKGQNLVLTSFVNRSCIHLIELDLDDHHCHSIALDITKKATEFTFKEKGFRSEAANNLYGKTVNNSLIDCHAEVWTKFPVVPAVERQTIVSAEKRLQRRIIFVTDRNHAKFSPYFSDLIRNFEQRTRKPTGEQLKSIAIEALSPAEFSAFLADQPWSLSQFHTGEWLVNLLCLIPIHIAITRENRFIPLKDGVTSIEFEKTLLGAEVGRIVDSLSVGWYESIFQSYMADKPVKVVSSMGEQSVGKSFALNHLVDTSFAGSAMRTTEGVWMSVTPTSDSLIVALDFEGVHSIERSTQEDTLLVLFNTAISNLVLFRNNFALSRDITGLFQSFQSSSTVLDPSANPSLFRSTLVIIIKDVVDSDKSEIVREFSLKFQKIVQDEQDANFISRLHAGQLNIVPWPVIESKQFYSLFPALKKRLDQQQITHQTAGEFLHTLKTLMAKLKANDWGALSQTLAAHRAQQLLGMLPNALAFGFSEVEPDLEPLKNLDNDTTIEIYDTPSRFFLADTGVHAVERQMHLSSLCSSWKYYDFRMEYPDKEWVAELSCHLSHLVNTRLDHVQEWISMNLSRFKTGHASIEELRRAFERGAVDMKANVELCGMQCSSCHLLCLLSRRHDPLESHDCQTSHQCGHHCEFMDEHMELSRPCSQSAGHPGKHICAVDAHLCGEPCILNDKKGCLGECTEIVEHAGDVHMCSARIHGCGEPCDLQLILANGLPYACPGTCGISSEEGHEHHICDNRMCPFECELCKRLCSNTNHLHGLEPGAIHLCGQAHSCSGLCSAEGICEIETAPQSIEATFTGRHETFQYTKYSQVAKRLPCIVPIPGGKHEHPGKHAHSLDQSPFHFCEARCESCGYFCTLPRGHPQNEHETHHGSMSKTRWAVDGPDGTILELNGRKFSSDDEGAPMMCNLVCQDMGRHVHLDYCRTDPSNVCTGQDLQHIGVRLTPNPDRPKDWISHNLFWRRSGFKDPYSRDDQTNFTKCDAMCGGPEHAGTTATPAQPSYCTLPMFHLPHGSNQNAGLGYVSNDGHLFSCKNPVVMQQAFHVIFVIDRSGSMGSTDRHPLPGTPTTARIMQSANNRLGAVYSSLYGFWVSRQAALNSTPGQATNVARRDAYSVILFDHHMTTCIENDFHSTPDQLLAHILPHRAGGGTDYNTALMTTQTLMQHHWSTERAPIVIFLSDGECTVNDSTMRGLCRTSIALGKPLSFHSVSFGPGTHTLRRMAQLALEVQQSAPRDPLLPATATVDSSYAEALDTVRLAETFLGIAESLRRPRGSLVC